MSSPNFLDVTETADTPISQEQLARLVNRYYWAAGFCHGRDVVEVACGTGPGLGLLASVARTIEAGDYSEPVFAAAQRRYGSRLALHRFDAQQMPFSDASKDVIILFEALYYLPHPQRFVSECSRVLRADGTVLIASANKDLWDFHPSPHSHRYFGVVELGKLFSERGFECQFFGFQSVTASPWRQRILRPLKRAAVKSGLMPKTMRGKRWLKRVVFGAQVPMPAELPADDGSYVAPEPIPKGQPDHRHKIIYCAATRGALRRDAEC